MSLNSGHHFSNVGAYGDPTAVMARRNGVGNSAKYCFQQSGMPATGDFRIASGYELVNSWDLAMRCSATGALITRLSAERLSKHKKADTCVRASVVAGYHFHQQGLDFSMATMRE